MIRSGVRWVDINDEEGWTLLPNGTVDANNTASLTNSEIFSPFTGVGARCSRAA
jgi:hypothetical protein